MHRAREIGGRATQSCVIIMIDACSLAYLLIQERRQFINHRIMNGQQQLTCISTTECGLAHIHSVSFTSLCFRTSSFIHEWAYTATTTTTTAASHSFTYILHRYPMTNCTVVLFRWLVGWLVGVWCLVITHLTHGGLIGANTSEHATECPQRRQRRD